MSDMPDYTTIKFPASMKEEYERLKKKHRLQYSSFSEFCKEALRRRFEEIRRLYLTE